MSEVLERMERLHKTEEARILREKNKAKRDFVERIICSPLAAYIAERNLSHYKAGNVSMVDDLIQQALTTYDAIEKHFSGEGK